MEKIALLPGGFKPPHAGHYNMAKWLATNTDANSVVIRVGSKERSGITREMSLKLWDLYRESDPDSPPLAILASENNSPVADVYDFIEQEAPEGSKIYLGAGEKDKEDSRYNNIGKFADPKNIDFEVVLVPPQSGGVSGTEMRGFIKDNDKNNFQKYLPEHLTPEQKEKAWKIVTTKPEVEEDFYDPRNKTVDFMRSSEWKAGMPNGSKDDIPRFGDRIHNRQTNKVSWEESLKEQTDPDTWYDDWVGCQAYNNMPDWEQVAICGEYMEFVEGPGTQTTGQTDPGGDPAGNYTQETLDYFAGITNNGECCTDWCTEMNFNEGCCRKCGDPDISEDDPCYESCNFEGLSTHNFWIEYGHQATAFRCCPRIIECYKCKDGYGVGAQFEYTDGSPCPKGWTTDPDPCQDNIITDFPFLDKPKKKPIDKKTLKEQQGGKTLRVYDFDDTLAVTKGANIKIKHEDGSMDTLDPAEFAVYKEQPGDKFDFTEFDRVIKEATPIQHIVDMLKKDVENPSIDKVTILTARLLAYPVKRYMREDLDLDVYVVAVGSSDPLDKATWIEDHILKGYNDIIFIDDSEPNRNAVKALKDIHTDINLEVFHPNDLSEMMMGTMNNQEKAKHAKNLKRLKKDLRKQGDQYIEVPSYLKGTLTKKIYKEQFIPKMSDNPYNIDNIITSALSINDKSIPLEIMRTPEEQTTGMMGREEMKKGMLFPYEDVQKREFHMEDCLIPLDIVFIDNGNIDNIHSNCPPCKEMPCPKYSGRGDNVLELPGGYCEKNNINVGDEVNLNLTENKIFKKITNFLIKENIKLPADQKIILQADTDKVDRGLIVTWKSSGGYDVAYWYEDPSNIVPAELVGDGESFGDIKNVYLGFHPELGDKKEIEEIKNGENAFTKKWWKNIINEMLLTEGGAAGHMAHPFNLPNVNSGKDLKDIFNKSAESLQNNPGSVKIDGVNSSIRLIDLDGEKQFVMDRGSKKELDIKGITKDDLLNRFGDGHGMVKIGGEVLDMFNEALPSLQSDLQKLGAWDDPNILFNMEYVSGKTNVQDYGSNFIAIHGLNKIESKEVEGKRGMLTKRVSSEISYNKDDLQSLLDNLSPVAKEKGFEVYGSVPTEMTKEPNFSSALSTNYTIVSNEEEKTQTLDAWLGELNDIPEEDFIFMSIDNSKKKVGAVSKQVYTALLNGGNIDELFEEENDKQKAIEGFTTYLATEKLGDEILKVLNSPMGSVEDHEGVVIRDENITNVPFKITGKFILGGLSSDF